MLTTLALFGTIVACVIFQFVPGLLGIISLLLVAVFSEVHDIKGVVLKMYAQLLVGVEFRQEEHQGMTAETPTTTWFIDPDRERPRH
jgi:hypothetical protein